jgi:integrase
MGEILKRHGGYSLRFYEGGKRRVLASKQTSYADARRMLAEIEARLARGEAGIPERRRDWPTVAELLGRFVREYSRPKLKDLERYRAQARSVLKKALPQLGKMSVARVQQSDIVTLRDALSKELAAGTVYNVLATLSAAFSWAVRAGCAPHNPCRGVERPSAGQALDFLSQDEARRLLDAAQARATSQKAHMLHVAIALVLRTGMRKGELLGLRWIDLDVTTRRLTIARSYRGTPKSGKARHLRLPSALVPILTTWRALCPQSPDGSVLPLGHNASKVGGKESMLGLPQLLAEIGLRAVAHPWHMLRHSFASHFVMQGGNLLALQRILGHSDVKKTMIYAHLAPDFLGEEMDRVKY